MPLEPRRRIPALPDRPLVHAIAGKVHRSFQAGLQCFSRAFQGEVHTLTITNDEGFPPDVQAILLTSLNAFERATLVKSPFERTDERTLTCRVTPIRPGFHSFRIEFSMDGGRTWLRDNVPDAWVLVDPPQMDALTVYTFIPTISGSMEDWKLELRRIQEMGFNAIHLLPITARDISESPYAAKDLFSVDTGYLAPGSASDGLTQLESLVEEAISLGLRLCFDLVLNHVGVLSDMAIRAPDWIMPDEHQPDGFQRAGYWSNHGWLTWDDIVSINYEHPSEALRSEIWSYMTNYALFWAKYANDTGGFVRLDNLHGSDPRFVAAVTQTLHLEYPELGIFAEYFTDEGTLLNTVPAWRLNLLLATPWDYKFVPDLRKYLQFIHRDSARVRYFMPITSHDTGPPAQEFGSANSTVPRYVAAALLGTGATGLPQGVEYGVTQRVEFIAKSQKVAFPQPARFGPFVRLINGILSAYPAFRQGANCIFVDNGHDAIIAAYRQDTEPGTYGFLVACNFDTSRSQSIVVDLSPFLGAQRPIFYDDLISGQSRIVDDPQFELRFDPCTAQVLRIQQENSRKLTIVPLSKCRVGDLTRLAPSCVSPD